MRQQQTESDVSVLFFFSERKQQYTFIWQMTIIGGQFFHFKIQ